MNSSAQPAAEAEGTPAATVVIFRRAPEGGDPEVLMVVRSAGMRFAAGAVVFPGGRVDEADRDLAASLFPDRDRSEMAARLAGVRETLEEAGLAIGLAHPVKAGEAIAARAALEQGATLAEVLDRFGWTLDLDRLVPWARWCPDHVRAFDTRFYLADLGTGAVELEVDGTEHQQLMWISPAEALRRAKNGELHAIFPTLRNLERLALHAGFAAAADFARAHPVRIITPWIEEREDGSWICIPDDLGYPVTSQDVASARRG